MNRDEFFLKEAIKQAKKAGDIGDVPIPVFRRSTMKVPTF